MDGLGGRQRVKYYQDLLSFSFLLNNLLFLHTSIFIIRTNYINRKGFIVMVNNNKNLNFNYEFKNLFRPGYKDILFHVLRAVSNDLEDN